jgi:hypothetical protein
MPSIPGAQGTTPPPARIPLPVLRDRLGFPMYMSLEQPSCYGLVFFGTGSSSVTGVLDRLGETSPSVRLAAYTVLALLAVLFGRQLSKRQADRLARLLSSLVGLGGWTTTKLLADVPLAGIAPVLYCAGAIGLVGAGTELAHRRGWEFRIPHFSSNGQPITLSDMRPSWYGAVFYVALSSAATSVFDHFHLMTARSERTTVCVVIACCAVVLGWILRSRQADRTSRALSATIGFSGAAFGKLATVSVDAVVPALVCAGLVALATIVAEGCYRRHIQVVPPPPPPAPVLQTT